MPSYRRDRTFGGTWFFTVRLKNRKSSLLVDQIELLRTSVKQTMQVMPFAIEFWVVLPDHMHCIWTLPKNDNDYPNRWKSLKGRFSRALPDRLSWQQDARRPREKGIWQNRYWEHRIRDNEDLINHSRYCYLNPVKHGLAAHPAEWPYSSYHRDAAHGLISADLAA
jgi:putative transposase